MSKVKSSGFHLRLLRVAEVAEMFGVNANTVRKWADNGSLPCYRFGPRADRRFAPEDIARFLARQRVSSPRSKAYPVPAAARQ